MSLTAEPFGALPDGSPVIRHTLSRTGGLTLRVLTYGGIVQSLEVPDARARVTNVVLGFASLDGYLKASDAYFGGLVGRFADRLAGGRFTLRTPHAHDALRQAGQGDLVSLWGRPPGHYSGTLHVRQLRSIEHRERGVNERSQRLQRQ